MKCKKCNADVVVHLYGAILWGTCDNEDCDWESKEITLSLKTDYDDLIGVMEANEANNIETTWAIDKDWNTIEELAGNQEKSAYLRCPAKAILWLRDKVAKLQEYNNGQDDRHNLLKQDCLVQTSRYALMVKKVAALYTNLDATDAIAEGHAKKIAKLDDNFGITDGFADALDRRTTLLEDRVQHILEIGFGGLDARLSARIAKIEAANPSNDGLWTNLNKFEDNLETEISTRIAAISDMGDRVRILELNYKIKREALAKLENDLREDVSDLKKWKSAIDEEIKKTNKDLDGKIESLDKNRYGLIGGLGVRIAKLEAVTPSEGSPATTANMKLLDKLGDDVSELAYKVAEHDGFRRRIGILENNVKLLLEDVGS